MKVAFPMIGLDGWTGGANYLVNVLSALKTLSESTIEPILFVGNNQKENKDIEKLQPMVSRVVFDNVFDRWSTRWLISRSARIIIARDVVLEKLFRKHQIDAVVFFGVLGAKFHIPLINWIPDFQHIHLPEMFSKREIAVKNKEFKSLVKDSRVAILSSESVKKDFLSLFPQNINSVEVLNFVANISNEVYEDQPLKKLECYDLPERFFYFPSQFWKHKNHLLVVESLKLLKEKGEDVYVVCTGNTNDYRDPSYFGRLKNKISEFGLEDRFIILGLVPFSHLFAFMRQSVALLNPSLFEGWSTTIEEAKSLGKRVLVSNLPVHIEQNAPKAIYFNPFSAEDLASKMFICWREYKSEPDLDLEREARDMIASRMKIFGEKFVKIIERTHR